MGASCVRWTADTERAFLLALRMTGQVVQAAAQIGRAPGVCYDRRKRVPAFAAAWAEVLSAIEAERLAEARDAREGGGEPLRRPLTRARRDGWTGQRQRAFCRALADTGGYGKAAARVGLSREAVRRFRLRSPEFQRMCDRALAEGGTSLEDTAWARAVEGWDEPVFTAASWSAIAGAFPTGCSRHCCRRKAARRRASASRGSATSRRSRRCARKSCGVCRR